MWAIGQEVDKWANCYVKKEEARFNRPTSSIIAGSQTNCATMEFLRNPSPQFYLNTVLQCTQVEEGAHAIRGRFLQQGQIFTLSDLTNFIWFQHFSMPRTQWCCSFLHQSSAFFGHFSVWRYKTPFCNLCVYSSFSGHLMNEGLPINRVGPKDVVQVGRTPLSSFLSSFMLYVFLLFSRVHIKFLCLSYNL